MRNVGARIVPMLLALAIVASGCTPGEERTSGAAPASLRPVSLPDLSQAAPSVQDQIKSAYASLMRQIEQKDTPASQLASAYGEMGTLLMAAEFGQAAESCLVNAEMLAPEDMRWPYYLGHLYKEQGATDKSTASFERALERRPDDVATLIWLGEAYLAENRPEAAESRFAKARSLAPRTAAALAGLGRAALARRDHASAVKYLEDAVSLDPQAEIIHYSLAMAYRGLGDLGKAEAHLQQRGKGDIVVPDPLMQEVRGLLRSASSYESLGIAALERGDSAGATMYFRKGLELAPDTASLHHRLGTALILAGDARGGQQEFEAALRISPDFARAHYSLAVILASTGEYQGAIERLSAAVQSEPDYLEARLLLADLLRHSGRPNESLQQYREILRIDSRAAEAQLGQALALVVMGQYQQARDRLTEASNARPDHPELRQALARVLAAAPDGRVRDGRLAVSLMEKATTESATPEMDETRAMAYAQAGDFQQAVAWQRKAIAAAEQAGRHPHVTGQMTENLRLFERGQPSRIPWREGTMP